MPRKDKTAAVVMLMRSSLMMQRANRGGEKPGLRPRRTPQQTTERGRLEESKGCVRLEACCAVLCCAADTRKDMADDENETMDDHFFFGG